MITPVKASSTFEQDSFEDLLSKLSLTPDTRGRADSPPTPAGPALSRSVNRVSGAHEIITTAQMERNFCQERLLLYEQKLQAAQEALRATHRGNVQTLKKQHETRVQQLKLGLKEAMPVHMSKSVTSSDGVLPRRIKASRDAVELLQMTIATVEKTCATLKKWWDSEVATLTRSDNTDQGFGVLEKTLLRDIFVLREQAVTLKLRAASLEADVGPAVMTAVLLNVPEILSPRRENEVSALRNTLSALVETVQEKLRVVRANNGIITAHVEKVRAFERDVLEAEGRGQHWSIEDAYCAHTVWRLRSDALSVSTAASEKVSEILADACTALSDMVGVTADEKSAVRAHREAVIGGQIRLLSRGHNPNARLQYQRQVMSHRLAVSHEEVVQLRQYVTALTVELHSGVHEVKRREAQIRSMIH